MNAERKYPYFNNEAILIQRPDHSILKFNPSINVIGKYPINRLGAEIVKRCNGLNSLQDIILDVSNTFESEDFDIIEVTVNFLNKLGEYGLLTFSEKSVDKRVLLKGDLTKFTFDNLMIELTYYCNLKCKHCYRESGPYQKNFINTRKLVSYLKHLASQGLNTIHLTGGEPLSHPDIINILEEVDKVCENIVILTNGTLINDNLMKAFLKISDKLIIQVDLDGNSAKSHDDLRGITGSFDRTCSSAAKLSDSGIFFSVMMNVHPGNLQLINQTFILSQELGASSFTCSPILKIGRASDSMILSQEQNIQFMNTLKDLHSKYPNFIKMPANAVNIVENRINCGAGSKSLVLSPLGNLRPCIILGDEYGTFGNIYTENYSELIDQQIYSYFSELQQPTPESCGDCEFISTCYSCITRPILYKDFFSRSCENFSCLWNKNTGFEDFLKNLNKKENNCKGRDVPSV